MRWRLLTLYLLVAVASAQRGHCSGGMPEAPLPTHAHIRKAIALSAGYLERACGPDGKFVYEVDINTGHQSSSYGIVRHAGAMYALAMLNRSHPDRKVVAAMARAASFLRRDYIGPGVRPDQLIVWSGLPGNRSEAELGATGLGLVALAEVRRVAPKSITLADLQALGRFLLFLQRDDGSFVLLYRPDTGPVEHVHNTFFSGEAALGLIALYEVDHSRDWLVAAGKALTYIARSRPEISEEQPDQWALIAIAKFFSFCDGDVCPGASRRELKQYSVQACDWIVHQQLRNPTSPLDGAFEPLGQPAVAAAFTEGLMSALEFLPKDDLRLKVKATSSRSVAFLLRAQIQSGPFLGGITGSIRTNAASSSVIRIDYVQHALSTWLRYQMLTSRYTRR